MEYYGHAGNILYVDLTSGHIRKEPLDIGLAQRFLGGQGIGVRLLYDLLEPHIDPLSPENVMVFGAGPLLGTSTLGGGKGYLCTKYAMPASREGKKYFISTSMAGSNRFASMMKYAGYDAVVVTGRAQRPCYLRIADDEVEICDAAGLWGKDIYETGDILRTRHRGKTGNCGTWAIGRAGENLVRFSLGFADDWHNMGRFAGAVAGAKNLKAIVTLGTKGIRIADRKRFMEANRKKRQQIQSLPNYQVILPVGATTWGRLYMDTMVDCKGCCGGIDACKSVHVVKEGKHKGEVYGGTFFAFARDVMERFQLKDYGEAFALLGRMNRHGLCILTATRMMWFVFRLYERGIISADDTGGLPLKVGELDSYLALAEKIVNRENIGALMAEGWYPLFEKLGVDASTDFEDGCSIVKGIDLLVDARVWPSLYAPGVGLSPSMGFASIVHAKAKHTHSHTYWAKGAGVELADARRDCEQMGVSQEELDRVFSADSFDTARLSKYAEDAETVYNALGICDTAVHWQYDPLRDIPWLAEVYSAATGFEITPRELLRAGERIWNMEKLLNVREGFNREDDRVPALYLKNMETPLKTRGGDRYLTDWFGNRLDKKDLEKMLDDYYEERGWDIEKGVPTRSKLTQLGLGEFIEAKQSGEERCLS